MTDASLTDDDCVFFNEAFQLAERAMAFWSAHEDEIAEKYEGQWLVLRGAEILMHSSDQREVQAYLDSLGPDGEQLLVKMVPRKDAHFSV